MMENKIYSSIGCQKLSTHHEQHFLTLGILTSLSVWFWKVTCFTFDAFLSDSCMLWVTQKLLKFKFAPFFQKGFSTLNTDAVVKCLWFARSVDSSAEATQGPRLGRYVNHGNTNPVRNARMCVLDVPDVKDGEGDEHDDDYLHPTKGNCI